MSVPFKSSQNDTQVILVFRTKTIKPPKLTLLQKGREAEVAFGKDTVRLALESSVESASTQVNAQNVIVTLRKAVPGPWEHLPGLNPKRGSNSNKNEHKSPAAPPKAP
eukprot:CAMPEP_0206215118 /NCGR_PEP_ID=MMETSP0047_2-20121206/2023_1 /ASSEMBLY_ACC=CAM_ASM_000192 /TAXON_ID=195065 /ORGANISM="Chroomonas mesostigmatica_cf, Strain CCMP1168" /LENGTH=107 /DNA_ID=CAMNT_0053637389 /DNA_START=26 /DNA_END=346 /DNA_ORIENTATION=+